VEYIVRTVSTVEGECSAQPLYSTSLGSCDVMSCPVRSCHIISCHVRVIDVSCVIAVEIIT
jgi:hypothetical protein